jgi:hypothetical protein
MAQKTLFDDTLSTDTGGLGIASTTEGPLAQSFNSGTTPVLLSDLKLVLDDANPSDGGTITVELFSDSGGSGPASLLTTLGTIADSSLSTSAATYDLSLSNFVTLAANTTYWIELTGSNGSGAVWEAALGATGTDVSGQEAYHRGALNSSFDFLMNLSGSAQETVFDDTGSTATGGLLIGSDGPLAQSFNTGSSPVSLTDLKLELSDATPGDGGSIHIELFQNGASGPTGTPVTLGSIADSSLTTTFGTYDVSISGAPTLTANTTYWIELTTTNGSGANWWASTTPTGTGTGSQQAYDRGAENSSFNFLMAASGSFCFAAGMRILTARGEVPVEDLRPGDLAVALRANRLAPIRWIGHRHVDLPSHPNPENINPVRIRAHAFGPGQPHTDLVLSPNHSLYIDGALIAVRYLLNGATIVQEAWDSVDYYHVELDTHDILLAHGLPAESYLDVGNRTAFENGGGPLMLHPEFAETIWAEKACAPFLDKDEPLARLRQTLLTRAESLGHIRTTDAALCVLASGQTIHPVALPRALRFDLPHGAQAIRLVSRSARPSQLQAEPADGRSLGVGIASIALDGVPVPLDHARLTEGWHAPEPGLRWTTGDATLQTDGARTLTLCLHAGMTYWAEPEPANLPQLKTA